MHIVIVGAGIAGLSAYLSLRKHLPEAELTILERHKADESLTSSQEDSPSTYGGGLGVSPNGMRALRHLSEDLHASVLRAGFPVEDFEFRTAGGYSLGFWPANSTKPTRESTVMMQRKALWKILSDAVGASVVKRGAEVITVTEDGQITLTGGEQLKADIIISAEGVRSVVREYILEPDEVGREPQFQNIMNQGGTVQTHTLKQSNTMPHVVMTFGPSGFFGYTPMSTAEESTGQSKPDPGPVSMWWSSYSVPPSQTPERTTNNPGDPSLFDILKKRHGSWYDPVIKAIVTRVSQDVAVDQNQDASPTASVNLYTPTWILPKLSRWTKGRIILIGDAAHALPSTSGQGASQALEDAVALAILLSRGLEDHDKASIERKRIEQILIKFEWLRKPRVEKILDASLRMQGSKRDLGWLETMFMYTFMWIMLRVASTAAVGETFNYGVVADANSVR